MRCVARDKLAYKGVCKIFPPPIVEPPCFMKCSNNYDPVCGKSGKTHQNRCIMRCVARDNFDYKGVCDHILDEFCALVNCKKEPVK